MADVTRQRAGRIGRAILIFAALSAVPTVAYAHASVTVTVTSAAPVVDVQSTTRQTVLNRELLDTLPAASGHPGFLAALIPGVESSTADVGGINGVGRGANSLSIHGGSGVQTQVQGLSM